MVDDESGEVPRRARVAVEHAGGIEDNVEELIRPPKLMTTDGGFDARVVPGGVSVRAASPGYLLGELPVVAGNGPQEPVTMRLKSKSPTE